MNIISPLWILKQRGVNFYNVQRFRFLRKDQKQVVNLQSSYKICNVYKATPNEWVCIFCCVVEPKLSLLHGPADLKKSHTQNWIAINDRKRQWQ